MNAELMTQLEQHLLKIKADPSFRDSREHREFVLGNAIDLIDIPRDQIRDLFKKVGLKVLWI
jgi:hypothetical protein